MQVQRREARGRGGVADTLAAGRADKNLLPPDAAACFAGGNKGHFNWRIPYVLQAPSQRSAIPAAHMSPSCSYTCPTASPTPRQPVLIISISSSTDFTLLSRVSRSQKAPGLCPLPGAGASPWSAGHHQIAELLQMRATPPALDVHISYFYN